MTVKLADTEWLLLSTPPDEFFRTLLLLDMRKAAVTVPLGEEKQLLRMSLWLFKASSNASRECITATRWCCAVPLESAVRAATKRRVDESMAWATVCARRGGIGSGSTSDMPLRIHEVCGVEENVREGIEVNVREGIEVNVREGWRRMWERVGEGCEDDWLMGRQATCSAR
jgi:hypothetical protein